jgi:hypothetical protein
VGAEGLVAASSVYRFADGLDVIQNAPLLSLLCRELLLQGVRGMSLGSESLNSLTEMTDIALDPAQPRAGLVDSALVQISHDISLNSSAQLIRGQAAL